MSLPRVVPTFSELNSALVWPSGHDPRQYQRRISLLSSTSRR